MFLNASFFTTELQSLWKKKKGKYYRLFNYCAGWPYIKAKEESHPAAFYKRCN